MRNVLIIGPQRKAAGSPTADPAAALAADLAASGGYRAARLSPDDETEAFCRAFDGTPPDLVIADLHTAADPLLPLSHLRRRLAQTWGESVPAPPCLALLSPTHLASRRAWMPQVDEFLLPPHHLAEARARIDLLLFRRRSMDGPETLAFAGVRLDLSAGRAYAEDGTPLPLRPREFDLLRFLITHRGKLFARERLLDFVWGVDYNGGDRTVDIHIRRLRTKLPEPTAHLLETRRGVGYGFRVA